MISARKAKHLDATTMFIYSDANTPLVQSERAYYLSYFINSSCSAMIFMCMNASAIDQRLALNPSKFHHHRSQKEKINRYLSSSLVIPVRVFKTFFASSRVPLSVSTSLRTTVR